MAKKPAQDPIIAMIRADRGLSVRIAEACGINRAAVYQWKRIPAERVQQVAPVIGLPPEEIRPDVFGTPKKTRNK